MGMQRRACLAQSSLGLQSLPLLDLLISVQRSLTATASNRTATNSADSPVAKAILPTSVAEACHSLQLVPRLPHLLTDWPGDSTQGEQRLEYSGRKAWTKGRRGATAARLVAA